ncbi:unnamed protein product [Lasius platythorax]|uniref:Uncharacterized protein n=1 Tax=Lasius platythorax TaxID=488582 RepID=A0AAV2NJB6_9HYME
MRTTVRYAGAPVPEKVLKTRRHELNLNGGLSDLERKTDGMQYAALSPRLSFSAAMAANGENAKDMLDGDRNGTK